ncbi:MAG TPA: YicC/YloC family endoribonuclease [Acidobacteriaceae bacterium]|nr:YicC/YloC family endoribonuclease [Acidobacteriaceae bacterium]
MSAPVYSMTGFARVSGRLSDLLSWNLSLKSVNHRFLDLHMRMPAGAESLEMRIRRLLKEKVLRGHLEVTLSVERGLRPSAHFDRDLLQGYIAAFRLAADETQLKQQPDLNAIFRLPGVLTGETRFSDQEVQALEEDVAAQIDPLVQALNRMRAQEGTALASELGATMERLDLAVSQVAHMRQDVQKAYFERLSQRISTLLNGNGVVDRDRIMQEAAILAERSDVEEEVTRLRTHIQHFHSLLKAGGEMGKKLDFLLQEMNREANTLLSKTGGVSGNGSRITDLGLGMKSEIEKAREQVQNLE